MADEMAVGMNKGKMSTSMTTVLERGANEAQDSQRAKRLEQHQHWMRVMMEGQATPDLRFQKPKV